MYITFGDTLYVCVHILMYTVLNRNILLSLLAVDSIGAKDEILK